MYTHFLSSLRRLDVVARRFVYFDVRPLLVLDGPRDDAQPPPKGRQKLIRQLRLVIVAVPPPVPIVVVEERHVETAAVVRALLDVFLSHRFDDAIESFGRTLVDEEDGEASAAGEALVRRNFPVTLADRKRGSRLSRSGLLCHVVEARAEVLGTLAVRVLVSFRKLETGRGCGDVLAIIVSRSARDEYMYTLSLSLSLSLPFLASCPPHPSPLQKAYAVSVM